MKSKLLVCTVAIAATSAIAGTPAIGIVTASGHVTVDRSEVWGNSTLFNGATVETTSASSDLALRNGVRLQLGAGSRAKVWADRVTLERGVGQVTGSPYELDAAGLKIRAGDSGRLRVTVNDHVEIAALSGSASVTNGAGMLLASVAAGKSISFSLNAAGQAGQTGAPVARTGCLLYKDSHFILQDDNTQEVVELNGSNLAVNVGSRVTASGTTATAKPVVSIATSVLNVTGVQVKSQGGCLSTAAALNAQTEAPANAPSTASSASSKGSTAAKVGAAAGGAAAGTAAGVGLSTGAIVGIVAAVAGGGAGAAIALSGHKSSTSP